MKTPVLKTNRLLLRPFSIDDVQDVFYCWENDPDVSKYMFWSSHNNIDKTKEWILFEINQIDKDDWYRFAIVLKKTNELIGTGLIYYEEEMKCFEIAYNLGKKYWQKGYASEAMQTIIQFAKEKLQLKEIAARVAKENIASIKVIEKLGFQYEKDILLLCNNGKIHRKGIQYKLYL